MLNSLAIRDVVLIDRLDLSFGPGLTVLTGETGAGKSILLDSLGLALGARGDSALVRAGQPQAAITAGFGVAPTHPARALLAEQGLIAEEEIVLRRVVSADGRSRAFVNDQAVSLGLLRRLGALLVEVQGQHEQVGLADPAAHAALLDSAGGLERARAEVAGRHRAWRLAEAEAEAAAARIAEAERDEAWLRHAVAELDALAPDPAEETALVAERQALQQGERRAEAIAEALAALAPRERRAAHPGQALRGAMRALDRLPGGSGAEAAQEAIGRALDSLAEAEQALERLANAAAPDPRRLEAAEERLFALRAAARKHGVPVAELTDLRDQLAQRLAALDAGTGALAAATRAAAAARAAYLEAATALRAARQAAAGGLEAAVGRELPPLRLDRARLVVDIAEKPEPAWGPEGIDRVAFLISTNPGQPPGALDRVASGGELSRLMLALKVVLSAGSPVPTLVFDEVDSGIGGATAAAVGERLARVADRLQVLVVTHSPQVAARGARHLHVAKLVSAGRAETRVMPLDARTRREEIARMLAGEQVTEAARAAADSLLTGGLL
jgi:DNA repair protein RecN (Recombination protein N)